MDDHTKAPARLREIEANRRGWPTAPAPLEDAPRAATGLPPAAPDAAAPGEAAIDSPASGLAELSFAEEVDIGAENMAFVRRMTDGPRPPHVEGTFRREDMYDDTPAPAFVPDLTPPPVVCREFCGGCGGDDGGTWEPAPRGVGLVLFAGGLLLLVAAVAAFVAVCSGY